MHEIIIPEEVVKELTPNPTTDNPTWIGYKLVPICMYRHGRKINRADPEFQYCLPDALYRFEDVKAGWVHRNWQYLSRKYRFFRACRRLLIRVLNLPILAGLRGVITPF